MSRSSPAASSRRFSVRFSEKDWLDLCHFLIGDIQNMDEGDPTKDQMRRIVDTIQRANSKSENDHRELPPPTMPENTTASYGG